MFSSLACPALIAMLALPAALGSSAAGSDGGVATWEVEELAEQLWLNGEDGGRELAVTSDENSTTVSVTRSTMMPVTRSTSSTTTPVPAVEIRGSVTLTVSHPEDFAGDPKVNSAIGKAIGQAVGVPGNYVGVTLSVVAGRRLEGSARRLAGSVKADYTISIPAVAPAGVVVNTDAADITSTMKTIPMTDLASKINQAVAAEGGTPYTVAVTSISDPAATVVGPTVAPSTTAAPEPVSFAKARVASGLCLALGFSAVIQ